MIDGRDDREIGGYKNTKSAIHEEIALKEAEEAFERGGEDNLEGFGNVEKVESAPETVTAKQVPSFAGDVARPLLV